MGFIGSLKLTTAVVDRETPVAPFAGTVETTVGPTRSAPAPVVNVWITVEAITFPATSATPAILSVYTVDGVSSVDGVRESVRLPLLNVACTFTGVFPA